MLLTELTAIWGPIWIQIYYLEICVLDIHGYCYGIERLTELVIWNVVKENQNHGIKREFLFQECPFLEYISISGMP